MMHILFAAWVAYAAGPSREAACVSLLGTINEVAAADRYVEARTALAQFRHRVLGAEDDTRSSGDLRRGFTISHSAGGPVERRLTARRLRNVARVLDRPYLSGVTVALVEGEREVAAALRALHASLRAAATYEAEARRATAPALVTWFSDLALAFTGGGGRAFDLELARLDQVLALPKRDTWAHVHAHARVANGALRAGDAREAAFAPRGTPGGAQLVTVDLLVTNVLSGVALVPRLIAVARVGPAAAEVAR